MPIATELVMNSGVNRLVRYPSSYAFVSMRVASRHPCARSMDLYGMKIILHIGAHRTATTSFQGYMRRSENTLAQAGIGFWGPMRTRRGLFSGILPTPALSADAARRARGRILLQLKRAQNAGVHTLVVSDENIMGSCTLNLRKRSLYPDVGERLEYYIEAFESRIDKVVISVRAQDQFWSSTAAFCVQRGRSVPTRAQLAMIANDRRSWRDVITDVAFAAPLASVEVLPFERFVGHPARFLAAIAQNVPPIDTGPRWLNRRPDAAELRKCLIDRGSDVSALHEDKTWWNPFDEYQTAALREAYADDMHWLVCGADRLALLTEDWNAKRAGKTLPNEPRNRGHRNDIEEKRMAKPG